MTQVSRRFEKNEIVPMNDPFMDAVKEHWDSIVYVFQTFEDKSPVLLLDIQEQRIYAYPYKDFVADFSSKDQRALSQDYKKVVAGQSILVFVRDNKRRKMVSRTIDRQTA